MVETKQPRRDFGRIYRKAGSRFLWVRYRIGGKEYVESSHSEKPREAEKLLARRQAELGVGIFVAPDVKRTTFEDLCRFIRDEYAVKGRRSTRTLEVVLRRLAVTFAGARAIALTPDRFAAYVRLRMEAGVAQATIRNELNALRHALRLAKRAGKVAAVPEFPTLGAPNVRTGFFEPEDFAALLAELPEPLRPVAEFGYLTGWRKGEILSLTWDRVDFRAGVVRLDVGTTKTGEGRTFPFAALPRLKELLEAQLAETKRVQRRTGQILQHVFHRDGEPIKDFFEAWKNACDRASQNDRGLVVRSQLVGRVFHDLRRTAVRNLVRAGVPEHTAMKLSGHKTRDVFDRYDIVSERDLSEAVTKLASFHGQQAAAR
ncbi:MAG: site-specific integrase [Gemmatimonadetes bacterium]|nr:MAG: site-specific integrase [Gemmatimonadota bacterium]